LLGPHVVLEVTAPCEPCSKIEACLGAGAYNTLSRHRWNDGWMEDRAFPDELLHPLLRQLPLQLFRQGHFDTGVFEAFKTLEVPKCAFGRRRTSAKN
jgi:hypothetical protein